MLNNQNNIKLKSTCLQIYENDIFYNISHAIKLKIIKS